MTRDELDAGLDDPGDPYGLANVPDHVLQYMAPMEIGEIYRYEAVRRHRVAHARNI